MAKTERENELSSYKDANPVRSGLHLLGPVAVLTPGPQNETLFGNVAVLTPRRPQNEALFGNVVVLTPRSQNETLFGNRVIAHVIT